MMKKLLLRSAFFLASISHAYAADFTAGGMEPFWSLSLTQYLGDDYEAELSYPNETGVTEIKATVIKHYHKGFITYKGKDSSGKPMSIMAIEKPCVTDGKGDTLSHVVTVNGFEGCGGKVIALVEDDSQEDNTQQDNQQSSQQKLQHHSQPLNPARVKAKQLNTKGFHLYKQGKYKQALPLFQRARRTDTSYVLGHYNFACTASIIARKYRCLSSNTLQDLVTVDNAIQALKKSIQLDPKRKAKSQTDPDLAALRKTYRYYRDILHYSPHNDRQLRNFLRKLDWTQAFGFYPHHGTPANIKFASNTFSTANNSGRKQTGRYTVHGGLITLKLNGRTSTGRLVEDADLGAVLRFSGGGLPFDEFSPQSEFELDNCNN